MINYVDKICSIRDVEPTNCKTYKLFGYVLDMIDDCQHILHPTNINNLSEGDYTYQLWLGLFNKLFAISDNKCIKSKAEESIQCISEVSHSKVL